MRNSYLFLVVGLLALAINVNAKNLFKSKEAKNSSLLKEVPSLTLSDDAVAEPAEEFKPSFSVGSIIHMFYGMQQNGYYFGGSPGADGADDWQGDFTILRARVLVGAQLSPKGNFFMETELPFGSALSGANDAAGNKSVMVMPMILDCQYEHVFNSYFSVVSGLQLVSHNRNGLQGAAGLMANDFTYYQYPYNMVPGSPLQGNLGRDLGVNFRGFFVSDKLEYRLGFFTGRTNFAGTEKSPVRTVGRLVYNVFDKDKSYYYSGTNQGKGKTLSIGGGVDMQGTYMAVGGDVFADMPAGSPGSVTLNGAFSYITGGNDAAADYSFATMIPTSNTQYLELGYFLTDSKIQPWIRYEKQGLMSEDQQTGGIPTEDFDKFGTVSVFGGGVNYWFNSNATNLRLSYTTAKSTFINTDLEEETKSYGQLWLQVQLFIF